MTDIPHIEIRQCHSYSKAGDRCEHPAGHTGKHYISVEWTDAEAWTPQVIQPTVVHFGQAALTEHLTGNPQPVDEPVHVGSGMCGICEHPHHPGGVCGADDRGYDCDCSNSVED